MLFFAYETVHELQFTADGQVIADPCGLDLSAVPLENLYESAEHVLLRRRHLDLDDLVEVLDHGYHFKVGGVPYWEIRPGDDADEIDSQAWSGEVDLSQLVFEHDLDSDNEDEIDTDELEPPVRAGSTVRSDRDPSSGKGRKLNKPFTRRARTLLARP